MIPGIFAAGAMGQGSGPPPGGFPVLLGRTDTAIGSDLLTFNINRPAVNAGDLLVYILANDGMGRVVTPPSGITKIGEEIFSTANGRVFYEIAGVTVGATTVAFTIDIAEQAACMVLRYQSGTFSGIPECTSTNGANANPDPPSNSPSGGSGDYAVVATFAQNNNDAVSVYPLPDNQGFLQSSATINNNCSIGICTDALSGSSFNPGTFTKANTNAWGAFTIAVKGA